MQSDSLLQIGIHELSDFLSSSLWHSLCPRVSHNQAGQAVPFHVAGVLTVFVLGRDLIMS
jgi:hypothetical protein